MKDEKGRLIFENGGYYSDATGREIYIQGDGGHAEVIRDVLKHVEYKGTAFVAIGNNEIRFRETMKLIAQGFTFASLIHPAACVSKDIIIGFGSVIMAGCVIQPGTIIGNGCIINTGATVDHDCTIFDYSHIAPGCVLCGNVTVYSGAFIGARSVCTPKANIPAFQKIKAGSIVTPNNIFWPYMTERKS